MKKNVKLYIWYALVAILAIAMGVCAVYDAVNGTIPVWLGAVLGAVALAFLVYSGVCLAISINKDREAKEEAEREAAAQAELERIALEEKARQEEEARIKAEKAAAKKAAKAAKEAQEKAIEENKPVEEVSAAPKKKTTTKKKTTAEVKE